MNCREMVQLLENLAPAHFAEDWDNVGLLAGRLDKDIQRVVLAVDATEDVIDQAVQMNADLLLTHHPLIFSGLKNVTETDFIGRRILKLNRHDICYYAMHTNFDVMGMADAAADEMKLKDIAVLDVTYEDEISKEGIGRTGSLPQVMTLTDCAEYCKKIFALSHVMVYGSRDKLIEQVAIVPGSGKEFIPMAVQQHADVLITGDIGHHAGIDAMEQGLAVIDAGHYGLEKIFVPYMQDFFRREQPELKIISAREQSPYYLV